MEMSGYFIKKVLESIHSESVRQQMEVMEREKKENNLVDPLNE